MLVLGELGWASHRQSKGSPTFPIVGTHDIPRQGITLPTDTAHKVICKRNKRRPFAGWPPGEKTPLAAHFALPLGIRAAGERRH